MKNKKVESVRILDHIEITRRVNLSLTEKKYGRNAKTEVHWEIFECILQKITKKHQNNATCISHWPNTVKFDTNAKLHYNEVNLFRRGLDIGIDIRRSITV